MISLAAGRALRRSGENAQYGLRYKITLLPALEAEE